MRNKLAQKIKLGAALLLMAGTSALAQISNQIYIPTPENIKARQEFQDNKFGIFLHWGIYSMTAQGEWYMNTHNINRDEYAKLASGFYPSRFNAAEWVSAIKTSGAKYICITSRHHDSFSMFDTKESDFNIVDATPFKRDTSSRSRCGRVAALRISCLLSVGRAGRIRLPSLPLYIAVRVLAAAYPIR